MVVPVDDLHKRYAGGAKITLRDDKDFRGDLELFQINLYTPQRRTAESR